MLDIKWTRKALTLGPRLRDEVERRIRRLHPYFPEMKRELTIGLTRAYDGLAFQSNEGTVKLMLDVRKARNGDYKSPTYWTIAHELMHLAQFNSKDVPGGERACDLYALSRLPPKYIDDSPSYLVMSKKTREAWDTEHASLAHNLARRAIRRRGAGERNYIVWWEREFERLTSEAENEN